MKTISFTIAKPLDGLTPYMGLAFIDSYGDVLLRELTLDDIQGDCKLLLENYFTPCGHCGVPVVDSSIMPDTQGMCDHCYKAGPIIIEKLAGMTNRQSAMLNRVLTQTLPEDTMQGFANMEDRIGSAVYMASNEFWKIIADLFPECKTGDLEPNYVFKMEEAMKETVTHWYENNSPKLIPRGNAIDGLNLYYLDTWHIVTSDIGCPVIVTDNVAVNGKHYYIAVDSKAVTFHEDNFKTPLLFNEQAEWKFGDNPTVLMNYIDEFMGGTGYWDTGKLFDDIMTIAKSGKC